MSAQASFVKIIHELANGVDKSIRDKALQKTQKYLLEHGHELSETDFARLWQGLYFCFWLTDKDYVQHQVGRFIARLIHAISPNEAEQGHHKRFAARFAFFKTFFSTMEEQWKTIDQHRSAKFMSLMRYVIHETFVFLRDDCAYSHQSIVAFTQVLRQGPLAMKQYSTIPILTHIIDIFVEEAEKVFARNESSKIYDVDEDIEYDALDFIKGQQIKTEKKPEEVLEIKFEDMMKLLDPFFQLYSQTPTDSIAIAFEKGMFKELEDYKAKDATIVEQVLQEPYLNKRGLYVAASLRRVEEYARPAKGSLQIDLNVIAAKFKELSQRTKTRNKQRCIEQHNRFVTATAQRKIRDKEDPLALFEQELSEVKSQKSSSSTKQQSQQKKSKAAEMLDESYHSDEDGDFEQQEDSDEEMEDLDLEEGDDDNEDAMDEDDLEDALEDLDEDLPVEVIRAFKQGKISVEELADMLDALEEQRSSAKGKSAAKAAQSAPAPSSSQKKQKQQQQATETAAAATIKKRKFGKGSEAAAAAPAQGNKMVEDQNEEVATPKATKASKKAAAPVAEVETSKQAEKATLSKISKSFQEKKKEQQTSSKITSSVAKAVAKQLREESSKAAQEESTSAVEDGDDEDRDKPRKRVSFGFQNNQTKVFAINTSPISLSHGVAAKNPPLVPLAAKKAKKRLSA